jgi:hypothetical protein
MPGLLDEILDFYDALSPEDQEEVKRLAEEATADEVWIPNPGPQTEAVECAADELFYGGQAGGGKSTLVCGLSLTAHERTLILRRQTADTGALVDELAEILGHRDGLNNSNPKTWRLPGRMIEIGGCQFEKDKQKYKGRPHDLIAFDEIADFTESQFRFIIGWNRSATPGQRSRVVCTGNPPTTPEGYWVLRYWSPWLDPTHPNPAKEGELRYFTTINGKDVECDGPSPVEVDGEWIKPRSRTFIRSKLSDNPDLAATDYDSTLAALPGELRDAYRGGKFDVAISDQPFQAIPTAWIQMAQERWVEEPPAYIPMSCIAHDVALGGGDFNAYSRRHGLWFDRVIKERQKGEVDPIDLAARDLELMRDGCAIAIDMGGGFGSGVYSHLKNNVVGLTLHAHNGANGSTATDRSKKFKFANKRAEVYWKFREALEPGLGQPVQLPQDPELLADLAATTWKLTRQGILMEEKNDIRKRIGRSPDKGDAVIMAWYYGESAISVNWRLSQAMAPGGGAPGPRVNLGHAGAKARRRRG